MYIDKSVDRIIEDNMMTFAQYVIKNRALPDLYSGVKPIHLKILWSMYENKTFNFTKSATVTGRVMAYSPHGDCYETIVNMIQQDRHAYNLILGQGNFGMFDSNDLQYASSRYTECKLSPLALDCLEGINKNMVEMIPNYDNTKNMPRYLPVKFPLILCLANNGMAVGMANDMPSFNLVDVCNATISELNNEEYENLIPDFANGGFIVNDTKEIESINKTGKGKVKLRAKYKVADNELIITEIPYNKKVFVETIVNRVIELVKDGKLKEVTNVLDQTGLNGLNIEISFKKGTNVDNLIKKLYKLTPLETSFSCNMNVLVDKNPKVLGVKSIIKEWIEFRKQCVKNGLEYDINKLQSELHLLHGLKCILLDIDEAVKIIRYSKDIIGDLKNKFSIDDIQAEYITNIKLKNINESYINKQLLKIQDMDFELGKLKEELNDEGIRNIIISQLEEVKKKFGKPRQTEIIQESDIEQLNDNELIEQYNCRLVYTQQGYIKKHLKQSDSHKIKDDDIILGDVTTNNTDTLLIFTDKANRYKISCHELNTYTPSQLGDYVYNITTMDKDEKIIKIVSIPREYNKNSYIICTFENGNVSKVSAEQFLSNNKKLQNCYNTESKLLNIEYVTKDVDVLMVSSEGKGLIYSIVKCNPKQSRNTKGVRGMKVSDDVKIIGSIIDVNQDYNFRLTTEKQKIIDKMLNDVVSNSDDRQLYSYLRTSTIATQGNFIYNTRSTNDTITKFELI